MEDEVTLWIEFDLHQIIRENDRVMIPVKVPGDMSKGQLKAAALAMLKQMKHEVFGTIHFKLADTPKTVARVVNVYPDKEGTPERAQPLLYDETDEVEPRIFTRTDQGTTGAS